MDDSDPDDLLRRYVDVARTSQPRASVTTRAVAEVLAPSRSRPWGWQLAAVSAAALALALLVMRPVAETPALEVTPPSLAVVEVGTQTAYVPEPDARVRVLLATADRTELDVQRGLATFRLFHDAAPHTLVVHVGDTQVRVVGTTFSAGFTESGQPHIAVHEGRVWVSKNGAEEHLVSTNERWPSEGPPVAMTNAAALLASHQRWPRFTPVARPEAKAVPSISQAPSVAAPPTTTTVPPKDLWRQAKTLRAQGQLTQATTLFLAVADSGDTTWAPLALLEALTIALQEGRRNDATAIAQRFERDFPNHQLLPEVRALVED